MGNMRFKVGDRVRIKSLDWYNENKDKIEFIHFTYANFIPEMSQYCGKILTINQVVEEFKYYLVSECAFSWTDEMIEGLVEEDNNRLTETVVDIVRESNDRYRIVIDPRFDIEVDEGEYYAVRRKKEYPKTYEECCEIVGGLAEYVWGGYKQDLFQTFHMLYICRDAYWKIAGEEMRLGKPWEPDFESDIYYIYYDTHKRKISKEYCPYGININLFLVFPTEETRDSFYENFKEEIEMCKELL